MEEFILYCTVSFLTISKPYANPLNFTCSTFAAGLTIINTPIIALFVSNVSSSVRLIVDYG